MSEMHSGAQDPAGPDSWPEPAEFETIVHANKPFSLRVPALVVTRGKDGTLNVMLSMWFTPMGIEPSCFLVAVDPKTKTWDLMMEAGEFVIAAPDESMFDAAVYAGAVSGHREDKWSACGFTPLRPKVGQVPLVREALANVELVVARTMPYDEKFTLVVGQVRACHVKSRYFRSGIYKDGANPLLWLGKASGEQIGNKTAVNYAAGMGRTWESDPASPLLQRIKRRL